MIWGIGGKGTREEDENSVEAMGEIVCDDGVMYLRVGDWEGDER